MNGNRISCLTLDGPGILSDRGIREAIAKKEIVIYPTIEEDQIQPATLDVRIGEVRVYDESYRSALSKTQPGSPTLPHIRCVSEDPPTSFARHYTGEQDQPIEIPSGAMAEIFFHESIESDSKLMMSPELRSGRGRLGLRNMSMFPTIENGRMYLSILNQNPNPIIIYGQDRFAQMLFFTDLPISNNDGYVVTNPNEAKDLASKLSDGKIETCGPYILFRIGDEILSFKKGLGAIDTRRKYQTEEIYDVHSLRESPFTLQTREPIIIQLDPLLSVPSDVGIRILPRVPYVPEPNMTKPRKMQSTDRDCVNAGWIDPGYEGHATAQTIRRAFPDLLRKGDGIAVGSIYKFNSPVERPYGSKDLGSHYMKEKSSAHQS